MTDSMPNHVPYIDDVSLEVQVVQQDYFPNDQGYIVDLKGIVVVFDLELVMGRVMVDQIDLHRNIILGLWLHLEGIVVGLKLRYCTFVFVLLRWLLLLLEFDVIPPKM